MLTSHIILVGQRDKQGRFVSATVWKKYNKVKIKRFRVDNELVDEKLQTLEEVGMVDWCLDEPFGLRFPYMLGDPLIISANFVNIGALSKRSKLGKNGRCHHILKTEKSSIFVLPLRLHSKILQV
jgi:hypothetical protein